MKISWNDFQDMLEALSSGKAAKELAEKEAWIKEMIGQANAVKSQASQNKADLLKIEEAQNAVGKEKSRVETDRETLKVLKAKYDHAVKELSEAKSAFEAEMTTRRAAVEAAEERVADLENRATQNFTTAQEKLDHINSALNA